jgi:hypothetical protein
VVPVHLALAQSKHTGPLDDDIEGRLASARDGEDAPLLARGLSLPARTWILIAAAAAIWAGIALAASLIF